MTTRVPLVRTSDKIEAYGGIDRICREIVNGDSLVDVQKRIGVSLASVRKWINDDDTRRIKLKEARETTPYPSYIANPNSPAQDKIAAKGIDQICLDIAGGMSMNHMARTLGVGIGRLFDWIDSDPVRAARVRVARAQSARHWDELAEIEMRKATDPFEFSKARELAQHFRWRAKMVAPKEYGDKVVQEHTGAGGGPITLAALDLKNMSDAELAQMQTLLSKAAGQ